MDGNFLEREVYVAVYWGGDVATMRRSAGVW
jgi:hypothetical protein